MKVSLVKESNLNEKRVLLLPKHVEDLSNYCEMQVQEDCGIESGISNSDYSKSGATIVDKNTAWQSTDFILKLKRPTIEEAQLLTPNTKIAALFHAEIASDLLDILLERKITSYSFEYFKDVDGNYPLMKATGEISGVQAIIYAAYHLQNHIGGSGKMLPSISNAPGAKVVILGYGNVGKAAAKVAVALGAEVIVFRYNSKLDDITDTSEPIEFYPWKKNLLEKVVPTSDVIIGAIRISTFDTPVFIEKSILKLMKKGSILIDVTAGYGNGYIESSEKVTSLEDPYYINEGIKHIKIREFPKSVHLTSTQQISSIYFPHILEMIKTQDSNEKYEIAENGIITHQGKIVNTQILKHYELRFKG